MRPITVMLAVIFEILLFFLVLAILVWVGFEKKNESEILNTCSIFSFICGIIKIQMRFKFFPFLNLFFLTSIFCGGGCFLFYYAFKDYFLLLPFLFGCLVFSIYYSSIGNFLIFKINITENGIDFLNFCIPLDKYVDFKQIEKYRIIKEQRNTYLAFVTYNGEFFKIDQENKCFSEVEKRLQDNKVQYSNYVEEGFRFRYIIIFLFLLAIGIIFFFIKVSQNAREPKTQGDLQEMICVLTKNPEMNYSKKTFTSLTLHIETHENYEFNIDCKDIDKIAAQSFISEINTGDTIILKISKSDYRKKLYKLDSADFFDRQLGWNTVEVYSLKVKDFVYFDFKE